MKKFYALVILICSIALTAVGQVSISTDSSAPDQSAMLDVKSQTKGLLAPRVALIATNVAAPVSAPALGLQVYNTATAGTYPYNVKPGIYSWDGIQWVAVIAPKGANTGDMQYWNGSQWVLIPAGTYGQQLFFCNGVPNWGGCPPVLTTDTVNNIFQTYAMSGGNISLDGGLSITARGVCWSTNPNPTIADSKTSDGTGIGSFNSTITGLTPNTTYHVRSYATNSIGTGYGNEHVFTTLCAMYFQVGVTISVSDNPVCTGTTVTFQATPAYGGTSPTYQWKLGGNNITGATNATYSYAPEQGDQITCVLTSNASCIHSNPAQSNMISVTVKSVPTAPIEGNHLAFVNSIIWQWEQVPGATGYKWGTTNDYYNAIDLGNSIMKSDTGLICNTPYTRYVWAYNGCGNSTATALTQATTMNPAVGVSIAASANPVCAGTTVSFTATPTNGGITPAYQWKKNDVIVTGATSSTYSYIPASNDSIHCQLNSSTACSQNNPAWSNSIAMAVNSVPAAPVSGTHTSAQAQIIWNWNTTAGATGYKWSTTNVYASAIDMGTATTKTETGLTCNTPYTRYVWAYNNCGVSALTSLVQNTAACQISITSVNASNITHNSAKLNCRINPNGLTTTVSFEYGLTTSYGSTINGTPLTVTGTDTSSIFANITGLLSNQLYHYRVKAVNSSGTFYSADSTFTTYSDSWNMQTQWSIVNNPNGTWSYGRKWSAGTNNFDIMPYKYNNTFWLLGSGLWYPSIQGDPDLWANDNSRGLPCVRWTCPTAGNYNLTASFIGADSRGVHVKVYVTKNESVIYTALILAYNQTVNFSFNNVNLVPSDHLDFLVEWNGSGNAAYNWTLVRAIITR